MALKKVKLNYMSATTHTEPKAKIKISSTKMEELDRAIKEKTRQNNSDFKIEDIIDTIYCVELETKLESLIGDIYLLRDNLKDNIYYSN